MRFLIYFAIAARYCYADQWGTSRLSSLPSVTSNALSNVPFISGQQSGGSTKTVDPQTAYDQQQIPASIYGQQQSPNNPTPYGSPSSNTYNSQQQTSDAFGQQQSSSHPQYQPLSLNSQIPILPAQNVPSSQSANLSQFQGQNLTTPYPVKTSTYSYINNNYPNGKINDAYMPTPVDVLENQSLPNALLPSSINLQGASKLSPLNGGQFPVNQQSQQIPTYQRIPNFHQIPSEPIPSSVQNPNSPQIPYQHAPSYTYPQTPTYGQQQRPMINEQQTPIATTYSQQKIPPTTYSHQQQIPTTTATYDQQQIPNYGGYQQHKQPTLYYSQQYPNSGQQMYGQQHYVQQGPQSTVQELLASCNYGMQDLVCKKPFNLASFIGNAISPSLQALLRTAEIPLDLMQRLLETIYNNIPNGQPLEIVRLGVDIANSSVSSLRELLGRAMDKAGMSRPRSLAYSREDYPSLPPNMATSVANAVHRSSPPYVTQQQKSKLTRDVLNDLQYGLSPQLRNLRESGYIW